MNPTPPIAPQSLSQLPYAAPRHPAHSPTHSPPTASQDSPRPALRTHKPPSFPGERADPLEPRVVTHDGAEPAPPHTQPLAGAPPSPALSPAHPEPFLLNSVTFTSHLYSPACALDTPAPPDTSCAPSRLATPPPNLSPPPPPELSPPPEQLLGSDDEEQEDPSDYCKGECRPLAVESF